MTTEKDDDDDDDDNETKVGQQHTVEAGQHCRGSCQRVMRQAVDIGGSKNYIHRQSSGEEEKFWPGPGCYGSSYLIGVGIGQYLTLNWSDFNERKFIQKLI
jgi:hypothetical protein